MPRDPDASVSSSPATAAPPTTEALCAQLRSSLTAAMKQRDRVAVPVLRSTIAAIENAEAVPASPAPSLTEGPIAGAAVGLGAGDAARRELTPRDVLEIIGHEMHERLEAADQYQGAGHAERAQTLRAEAAVLAAFLTDERRRRFLRDEPDDADDAGPGTDAPSA